MSSEVNDSIPKKPPTRGSTTHGRTNCTAQTRNERCVSGAVSENFYCLDLSVLAQTCLRHLFSPNRATTITDIDDDRDESVRNQACALTRWNLEDCRDECCGTNARAKEEGAKVRFHFKLLRIPKMLVETDAQTKEGKGIIGSYYYILKEMEVSLSGRELMLVCSFCLCRFPFPF